MIDEYTAFLERKAPRVESLGIDPSPMPPHMTGTFAFQGAATSFCIRQGRAALFLDTGLGKTSCELEFAKQGAAASNGYALILSPLAVARQIETEGLRFGYDCRVIREMDEVRPGINICNYDRIEKLDPSAFGCVVLDESGVLKNFSGKTTRALIAMFQDTPFRLCATATPAPNDHVELGNHAEFLGIMTQSDMLIRWFINDSYDAGTWRLKKHAVTAFWDWVSSWAVMASSPEDLGFDGSAYVLPPMEIVKHKAQGIIKAEEGSLFAGDVSATNMHAVKRQTADARADIVAALVAAEPDEAWVIWCDTDYEADALTKRLPDAADVRGSHDPDKKEARLASFSAGTKLSIITKPSVAGMGLNWQHSARMIFAGRSFSYETWYQAVRRCWRFGQTRPVVVHLIVAEGEDQIGRVIDRKAEGHVNMKRAMIAASRRAAMKRAEVRIKYNPTYQGKLPTWLISSAA